MNEVAHRSGMFPNSALRYSVGAFLCLFLAIVIGYFFLAQLLFIKSINIENSSYGNRLHLVSLPLWWGVDPGRYTFNGAIWMGDRAIPRISIDSSTAIDQIEIGGRSIEPSCRPIQGLEGHWYTIRCDLDLRGSPRNALQSLAVSLSSRGRPFALDIEPSSISPMEVPLGGALLTAVLVLAFLLCRAAHQSWIICAILTLALGVRLVYWVKTPPNVRGHDVTAHIEYVALVAQNWARPGPLVGWETHQAPLYYYIGGGLVRLERFIGVTGVGGVAVSLQGLSLVFAMLTAIGALLCFKECAHIFGLEGVMSERTAALALALYVFWPTAIMDSVRIGNDAPLVLLAVTFLFFILRWHSRQTPHNLLAAFVTIAFAIVTKASAVLLIPVLGLAAGLEWCVQPPKRTTYKHLLWLAPLLIIACLITFGPAIRERMADSNASLFIGPNPDRIGAPFAVGNRPSNYLMFNVKQFIARPFTDLFRDEYGRQLFWHYFWKTSLFGELLYGGRFKTPCGSLLCALLLLLIIMACTSLLFGNGKQWRPMASIVAFAAVWIGGTVALSVLHPFSPDRDFRLAAPSLASICWLAALSDPHFALRGWPRVASCAAIILILFSGASLAFILMLPISH